MRSTLAAVLLAMAAAASAAATAAALEPGTDLVLGSGGLIGRYVVRALRARGRRVLEVRGRHDLDLREAGALDAAFEGESRIDMVYFLACEVGGSKFLETADTQAAIVESNVQMYENVFSWLQKRDLRFVFTSSYLEGLDNAYGAIKRLGEHWIRAVLPEQGRVARLWNVYGTEPVSQRSHVLTDWAHQCVTRGHVQSLTTGWERRQFLFVEDCAEALVAIGEAHAHGDVPADAPPTHVSSGQWITLRDVAALFPRERCSFEFDKELEPRPRPETDPLRNVPGDWTPKTALRDGIAQLIADQDALAGAQQHTGRKRRRKQDDGEL